MIVLPVNWRGIGRRRNGGSDPILALAHVAVAVISGALGGEIE